MKLTRKEIQKRFENNPYITYRLSKDRHGRYQSSETMSEYLGYLKAYKDLELLKEE